MKRMLLTILGGLLAAGPALAADVVVVQQDKLFDRAAVAVKVGDRLVFRNDDNTAHNVHSATNDHRFDLGLQKPGESATLTVDTPGSFSARCAIHPKMKLEVSVAK